MQLSPREAADLERYLTPEERAELSALVAADVAACRWRPLPGPQTMAYSSPADVVGFGGAAGGGKSDLALGLALNEHKRVQIFRLEAPQLEGLVDRMGEMVGGRDKVVGKPPVYREGDQKIEFCSMPNPGDEQKYQGRPKDLLVVDEATHLPEARVRFVKGWVRSATPGQRCRTLMTFNPPTCPEERWVIDYFGPWLNKRHPLYPSAPGALRYVYVDPRTGKDVWIPDDDPRQFALLDGRRVYTFNPLAHAPEDIVTPESRTFIPAKITDNPFLVSTGYMAQLQALPEPLRSQMLYGDFRAGVKDDAFQVMPTAWVEAAMERWRPRAPRGEMMGMGVDVARGGDDQTIIATRHRNAPRNAPPNDLWFDQLKVHPGSTTPDGNVAAALVMAERRDGAPIHIDVIGVGASPFDVLNNAVDAVYGLATSEKSYATDKSGRLSFNIVKAELAWNLRDLLDPANDTGICLPPDDALKRELCCIKWKLKGSAIAVSTREEIIDALGHSFDRAAAVMLAAIETPKREVVEVATAGNTATDERGRYSPFHRFKR